MSGHSKWSQIKRKKGASDQKKSASFGKFSKLISIAARDNPDINSNFKLQTVVNRAKEINMPKDSIDRAIKKANDSENKALKEIIVNAVGPENTAFVIKAITDNSNRTIQELKSIFHNSGLKMTSDGSLDWMFDKNQDTSYSPKYPVNLESEEVYQKIIGVLEEIENQDDVEEVYFNFEIND